MRSESGVARKPPKEPPPPPGRRRPGLKPAPFPTAPPHVPAAPPELVGIPFPLTGAKTKPPLARHWVAARQCGMAAAQTVADPPAVPTVDTRSRLWRESALQPGRRVNQEGVACAQGAKPNPFDGQYDERPIPSGDSLAPDVDHRCTTFGLGGMNLPPYPALAWQPLQSGWMPCPARRNALSGLGRLQVRHTRVFIAHPRGCRGGGAPWSLR